MVPDLRPRLLSARLLSTLFACFALASQAAAAPPTCITPPKDHRRLVPDAATAIVTVDVDAVAKTSLWRDLEPALHSDLAIGDALRLLKGCGVHLDRIYAATIARDADDGRLLVLSGHAVGRPDTLACVDLQLRARHDGASSGLASPQDGGCLGARAIQLGSTTGRLFVLNAYTVVYAQGAWTGDIEARLTGRLPLSPPRGLMGAAAPPPDTHLWLTATLTPQERQVIPGTWAQDVIALHATVELDEGLRIRLTTESSTVGSAASTRAQVIASLQRLAASLTTRGADLKLASSPRVGIHGKTVSAEISITRAELRSLRDALGDGIRGRGLF